MFPKDTSVGENSQIKPMKRIFKNYLLWVKRHALKKELLTKNKNHPKGIGYKGSCLILIRNK